MAEAKVEKKQSGLKTFGRNISRFFREVKSETSKIVWPTYRQTVNNTIVVIICVAVVGAFVSILDVLFTFGWGEILKLI